MRPYQRRADPELSRQFAKDAVEEDFLERLNAILAPHEEAEYRDLEERFPTLHVVGAPRSGTTLLYQLVASGLEVGYVNNLVAAFWRAPATGIRLSRKLRLDAESSFDSSFGRTQGIQEPHEFGYFWNHHLRYPDLSERPAGHEETIDWPALRRVILNMAEAQGGPVAFKPMLLVWHLEAMVRHMPRTCYVWIRREQRDTALSLMKMRLGLRGSYEAWASLQPLADLDGEPPWRQVAAQVVLLERTIEDAARRLGPDHLLPIRYERVCAEPAAVLEEIRDLMGAKGHAPARRARDLPPFREQRNEALEAEFGARIDEALEHYGGLVAAEASGRAGR
jgi:sulfotransferase family protein